MSLKAYLSGISLVFHTDDQEILSSLATVKEFGIIFENNVIMSQFIAESTTPFASATPFNATDTLNSIRQRLQSGLSTLFNQTTGRTDGNTIQYVWLDDKGIL